MTTGVSTSPTTAAAANPSQPVSTVEPAGQSLFLFVVVNAASWVGPKFEFKVWQLEGQMSPALEVIHFKPVFQSPCQPVKEERECHKKIFKFALKSNLKTLSDTGTDFKCHVILLCNFCY